MNGIDKLYLRPLLSTLNDEPEVAEGCEKVRKSAIICDNVKSKHLSLARLSMSG